MEGEQLIIILSLNLIVVIYSERWSHVKRHQKQQIVEFTQRVFLLSRKIYLKLKETTIMLLLVVGIKRTCYCIFRLQFY